MKKITIVCCLLATVLLVTSCANRTFSQWSDQLPYRGKEKKMKAVKEEKIEEFTQSLEGLKFIEPYVLEKPNTEHCKIYFARKVAKFLVSTMHNRKRYFDYYAIVDMNHNIQLGVRLPVNSYSVAYLDKEICNKGFYITFEMDYFKYKQENNVSHIIIEKGVEMIPAPYFSGVSAFFLFASDSNANIFYYKEKVKILKDAGCWYRECNISVEKYTDVISSYFNGKRS